MLLEVVAVAAIVGHSEVKRPERVKYAMAAALLAASGEKRYEPPTQKEVPAPKDAKPPMASVMPAPPMSARKDTVEPAPSLGLPRPGQMPAPVYGEEKGAQIAQAPTNEELARRIEQLERENRQLRSGSSQQMPAGAPSGARMAPSQMIPGWRIGLYPWNPEGFTTSDAMKVFNMRNQRFTATLGQGPVDRKNLMQRRSNATNEMFVYRMTGWLRVSTPGQYQLGFETNCKTQHSCNLVVKLGGQQLMSYRQQKFDNSMLYAGLDLQPGDYEIEVTFALANNKFLTWSPNNVTLYPMVRGPNESNFRDFGDRELVTLADGNIPSGMPARGSAGGYR